MAAFQLRNIPVLRTRGVIPRSLTLMTLGALLSCSSSSELGQKSQSQALPGGTGIPECDGYIMQYSACAQQALPPSQASQVLAGVERKKQAWIKLAETSFKKASLARVCSEAIETARVELAGWNCAWQKTSCGNLTVEPGEACDDGNLSSGDGCSASCLSESTGSGGAGSGGAGTGGSGSGGAGSGGAGTGGTGTGGTGTGGAGTGGSGGSSCTVNNAIDLGAPGTPKVIARNACVKVQNGYPSWWGTRNMQLQTQDGGTYPTPFSWSSTCAPSSGTRTFTANWQNVTIGPTKNTCATLLTFTGPSTGTIKVAYYGL